MMKILIYSHYFTPSVGGVERMMESRATGFARRGHRVTVATQTPADPRRDSLLPYVVVRAAGILKLAKLILENDIVYLAGPTLLPLAVARALRKPIVVEHHVYQAICPNGLLIHQPDRTVCPGHFLAGRHGECLRCNAELGKWRGARRWLLAFPRLWLCRGEICNVAITEHVNRRLRLPRCRTIYYGVPTTCENIAVGAASYGRATAPCFAYVGRLVAEKGLPVLVDAAARLREKGLEFRLKFVGDGPERGKLEAGVAAGGLGDRVAFTGMLGPEGVRLETTDVAALIMPSVWEETAGLAAMEQLMRGKVVIASDIGGLGEVVNGAGLKFAPGDAEALAQCMRKVIEDPGLMAALGAVARRRAETLFERERMLDQHLELYRSLAMAGTESATETAKDSKLGDPRPPQVQVTAFKRLIREFVPRSLQNWLRSPSKSAEWIWDCAQFSVGVTRVAPLLQDWGLRCHPRVYKVVIRDQINDPEQREEFRNFVSRCSSRMFLFDVGAHFGVFSLAAAHHGGRAVAFDPSPTAIRMLRRQAALNGLSKRIEIVQAALDEKSGTLGLLSSGVYSDGYLQVSQGRILRELTQAPAVTIDEMTARFGAPTHIKIDVEGHEAAVLRGARQTLERFAPVLFIELHNQMVEAGGGDPESALAELDRLHYATFSTDGEEIRREAILKKRIIRISTVQRSSRTGMASRAAAGHGYQ